MVKMMEHTPHFMESMQICI